MSDSGDSAEARRQKLIKRLRIVESFRDSGNDPAWMILDAIPVLPPDLRPLATLEDGRQAVSDVNSFYRLILYRNLRLKKLLKLKAPDIIINNEKRLLQEAVDLLFDSGLQGRGLAGPGRRPLKSLADLVKGRPGRSRPAFPGKFTDFSGRAVIVSGPDLKLHQCGLPKEMALELFKPIIGQHLEKLGLTAVKAAKILAGRETDLFWRVLSEAVREHPILLSRTPALSSLSIRAFEPILIEGQAIQLHPLVCAALSTEFDGSQMSVHLPLSLESQIEARVLLMSTGSLLSPASGEPIIVPAQDIVLGLYYMTLEKPGALGEGRLFSSPEEVRRAFEAGALELQAGIMVRLQGTRVRTTCGRVLLQEIIPAPIPFREINKALTKNGLRSLTGRCLQVCGAKKTVRLLDSLKDIGFKMAAKSGVSADISSLTAAGSRNWIPDPASGEISLRDGWGRERLVTEGGPDSQPAAGTRTSAEAAPAGTLTSEEKVRSLIRSADHNSEQKLKKLPNPKDGPLPSDPPAARDGRLPLDPPAAAEAASVRTGAAAKAAPAGPLTSAEEFRAMIRSEYCQFGRRLIKRPDANDGRRPWVSPAAPGLDSLSLMTDSGALRDLAETAVTAAGTGRLTRRLAEAVRDVIVTEKDCLTQDGLEIEALREAGEICLPLAGRILGRTALFDILSPKGNSVLAAAGAEIGAEEAAAIEKSGLTKVLVRSVLTCRALKGVCAKCCGRDLASGRPAAIGQAAGIIAAQSLGEQADRLNLSLEQFSGDSPARISRAGIQEIADGISRLEELLEAQKPKDSAVISRISGVISISGRRRAAVIPAAGAPEGYFLPRGLTVTAEGSGFIRAGEALSSGRPNPHDLLAVLGVKALARYLIDEIQLICLLQPVRINDRHLEVIVRQMLRKVRIKTAGATEFLAGEVLERAKFEEVNEAVRRAGREPAAAEPLLLGISQASGSMESFISAAGSQDPAKVLAEAAAAGQTDSLTGLRENAVLGRLIPAGTGLPLFQD